MIIKGYFMYVKFVSSDEVHLEFEGMVATDKLKNVPVSIRGILHPRLKVKVDIELDEGLKIVKWNEL